MKFSSIKKFKKQAGLTNIQIAVGIAVVALSVVGGLFLLKYPELQKIKNEQAEIIDLRSSSIGYATGHGGLYTGMSIAVACDRGYFPAGRCTGSGATAAVTNNWGGVIAVSVVTLTSANTGIKWSYPGLSSRACIEEITDMWHAAAKIDVGTTAVKTGSTQALDDTTLVSACQTAADNATVHWTFAAR